MEYNRGSHSTLFLLQNVNSSGEHVTDIQRTILIAHANGHRRIGCQVLPFILQDRVDLAILDSADGSVHRVTDIYNAVLPYRHALRRCEGCYGCKTVRISLFTRSGKDDFRAILDLQDPILDLGEDEEIPDDYIYGAYLQCGVYELALSSAPPTIRLAIYSLNNLDE